MTTDSSLSTDRHTPGPWEVKPVDSLDFRRPGEDGAKDLCIVAANGICPGIVWDYLKEGEANARLFAAAPDMIEALREAEEALRSCYQVADYPANGKSTQDMALRTVRDAIAKAEGRS